MNNRQISIIERQPFSLNSLAQRDFLNWIESQFPNLSEYSEKKVAHPEIESRFKEVNDATMSILDLLIDNSTFSKKKIHRKNLINLSFAFEQKDLSLYTRYLEEFLKCLKKEKK